jgi:hypothetical protein
MPVYGLSVGSSAAAATAAAFWEVRVGSTRRVKIYKQKVTNTTTVVANVGLILASNTPAGTATQQSAGKYDSADAAAAVVGEAAWTTAPTVGTTYLDQFTIGGAAGNGIVEPWQSDKEITLAAAASLIYWNWGGSTGPALSIAISVEE